LGWNAEITDDPLMQYQHFHQQNIVRSATFLAVDTISQHDETHFARLLAGGLDLQWAPIAKNIEVRIQSIFVIHTVNISGQLQ
jgi:hypothetical protein